jgi:PKD repeat protein
MYAGFNRSDTVILRNSVIAGFERPVVRTGSAPGAEANLTSSYSAYPALAPTPGTPGTITETNKLTLSDAGFASASPRDLHPRADSPLVDAGDPAEAPGSGRDLAGQPRVADASGSCTPRTDIGAYELQPGRRAPKATAAATPSAPLAGGAVAFSAAGSCDPDLGDTLSYAWTFDDDATAAGADVSHAFATTGPHTGTVTVTDAGGRSTSATALVKVTASTPPVGAMPPVAFAGLKLATSSVRATSTNVVRFKLACPVAASGTCTGTVTLTQPASAKAKAVTLGTARFSIAAGRTGTVAVKLTSAGRRALRSRSSLKSTVTIAGRDSTGAGRTTTGRLTLRAARATGPR